MWQKYKYNLRKDNYDLRKKKIFSKHFSSLPLFLAWFFKTMVSYNIISFLNGVSLFLPFYFFTFLPLTRFLAFLRGVKDNRDNRDNF